MYRLMLVAYLALFLSMGCSSSTMQKEATQEPTKAGGSWATRMQDMASSLEKLLPYVFSQQEFRSPENQVSIKKLMGQFAKSIEVVPQHTGEVMLGKDPLVAYSLSRLKSNTGHAIKAYNEGHIEFSRNVLRENLGLCFSCHTTTQFGPENNFSTQAFGASFRMQTSEKAEFYVATRQFDKAVQLLENALSTPSLLLDDPHDVTLALKKYLSLQVRVKKDPARAASLMQTFLSFQNLPYFLANDGEAWLASLREWQREAQLKGHSFKRAQTLLKAAQVKQGRHGYQSAYVEYLRASALLHESLRETQNKFEQAKIYQMLGQSYDTLSEAGTWDLPEVYFEACVRVAPGAPIAKECFKDYERSIILGFSGSAGIFIPKEEREKLAELKKLSGI